MIKKILYILTLKKAIKKYEESAASARFGANFWQEHREAEEKRFNRALEKESNALAEAASLKNEIGKIWRISERDYPLFREWLEKRLKEII